MAPEVLAVPSLFFLQTSFPLAFNAHPETGPEALPTSMLTLC